MQQGYPIVYMDKSGFEAETIRPYGYWPIGKPCLDSYNWLAKKRDNVIGALYKKRLFALEYVYKNVNWKVMYDWCKYTLIPSLKTKCVIIVDMSEDQAKYCFARAQDESCARVTRFHINKPIRKLLNRYGRRILWLPPYSPDLNPIEKK